MSADDRSVFSDEPARYRKLAAEVRALIASGTLRAQETLEDLLQLAAWYEAQANQQSAAHHRSVTNSTDPPAPPRAADETWEKALIPKG